MHNIFVFVDPDTSVNKIASAKSGTREPTFRHLEVCALSLFDLGSIDCKIPFLPTKSLIEFWWTTFESAVMLVIQIYGLGFKNWMICWVLGVGPKVGLLGYLEVYVMMIFNIEYLQGSTFDFYSLPKKHTS